MASLVVTIPSSLSAFFSKGPKEDFSTLTTRDSSPRCRTVTTLDQKEPTLPPLPLVPETLECKENFDWEKKEVVQLDLSQSHLKIKDPSLSKLNSLSNAIAGSTLCFMLRDEIKKTTDLASAIEDGIARYHMAKNFSKKKSADLDWPSVYNLAFKPELILYSPDEKLPSESTNLLFAVPISNNLECYFFDLITQLVWMAEKFQNEKLGAVLTVEDLSYGITINKNKTTNEWEFEFCDTYGYSSEDNHSYLMHFDTKIEFLHFLSAEFDEDDDGIPIDQSKIGFFFLRKRQNIEYFFT
jgi:hypothetical protein